MVWVVIDGRKVWPRKCNHCGNIVYHTNATPFYIARKHNKRCEKCRQPTGEKNSFYGHKHNKETCDSYSKQRRGKLNSMYGCPSAFRGCKHTSSAIRKQQVKKRQYWKKLGHECTNEFLRYRWEVDRLTRKQPIHILKNVDKRGKAGINGAYHLDHIKSVWRGYNEHLPEVKIARIENLQFIPWMENQKKWFK